MNRFPQIQSEQLTWFSIEKYRAAVDFDVSDWIENLQFRAEAITLFDDIVEWDEHHHSSYYYDVLYKSILSKNPDISPLISSLEDLTDGKWSELMKGYRLILDSSFIKKSEYSSMKKSREAFSHVSSLSLKGAAELNAEIDCFSSSSEDITFDLYGHPNASYDHISYLDSESKDTRLGERSQSGVYDHHNKPNYFHLVVSPYAPTKIIEEQFSRWLENIRNNYSIDKRWYSTSQTKIDSLLKNAVLPFLDLYIWSLIHSKKIPYSQLNYLLTDSYHPNDVVRESEIRADYTKKMALNSIQWGYISSLKSLL